MQVHFELADKVKVLLIRLIAILSLFRYSSIWLLRGRVSGQLIIARLFRCLMNIKVVLSIKSVGFIVNCGGVKDVFNAKILLLFLLLLC